MAGLLESIQDFPVIVQGAMGSALFALVLYVGQKSTAYGLDKFRLVSKRSRYSQLLEQHLRLRALKVNKVSEQGSFAALMWMRASRHVIKGFIWLVLGMAFDFALGPLSVVGYMGALYYLFMALNVVKPIVCKGDLDEEIARIAGELKEFTSAGGGGEG